MDAPVLLDVFTPADVRAVRVTFGERQVPVPANTSKRGPLVQIEHRGVIR